MRARAISHPAWRQRGVQATRAKAEAFSADVLPLMRELARTNSRSLRLRKKSTDAGYLYFPSPGKECRLR